MPPIFAFFIAGPSRTFTLKPFSFASAVAFLAKTIGVKSPPGRFTKSRAVFTPVEIDSALAMADLILLPDPRTVIVRFTGLGGLDFKAVNS